MNLVTKFIIKLKTYRWCSYKRSQDKTSHYRSTQYKTSQASKRPKPQNILTPKRPNFPTCGGYSFQLKISIIHLELTNFLETSQEFINFAVSMQQQRPKDTYFNALVSQKKFGSWDVLGLGRFEAWEDLWLGRYGAGTFYRWDLIQWDVLYLRRFQAGTFCLGSFCRSTI